MNILKKELNALNNAINEFKKGGIKINNSWLNDLYEINSKIWD